jgi:hypothetical protein
MLFNATKGSIMAGTEFNSPELEKLAPDVRSRVQAALKTTLEQQLASVAGRGDAGSPVAAHSRSQGAFFSRSKTSDVMRGGDDLIAQKVATLDDAAFEKFAARLATLKRINRG